VISRKVLLPAVLSLALAGMTDASAEAPKRECTGSGQAFLGSGISYFPTITTNVSFSFTFNCATGGSVGGSGVLATASCGKSSGSGTFTGSTKTFTVETVGSMLIVTGPNGTVGAGNATPIPDTSTIPFSNSCSNGTAKVFQLVGTICADTGTGAVCT